MIDSVKVCGMSYQVIESRPVTENGDVGEGHISYSKMLIEINPDLVGDSKVLSVWHEVCHAILMHTGHFNEKNDEQLMEALSMGLVQLIRDNPQLVEMTLSK